MTRARGRRMTTRLDRATRDECIATAADALTDALDRIEREDAQRMHEIAAYEIAGLSDPLG